MEEFANGGSGTDNGKRFELQMDSLLDIPVEVSVEIGKTQMSIGALLVLSKGSILELDKLAGDYADIYVNHKLLGKGEIVVVNERLGVRLIEIIAPKERVQELG